MTEHPAVVDGFVDVYDTWIDLGIDGFRIDTAKHVNFEFWQQWSTQVLDYAHAHGKPDFFMFGEVYDADPVKLSPYVRQTDMNSVLDFTFQSGRDQLREGQLRQGPAEPVRRRRLLHDQRHVGDGAADLPRQSRHGSRRVLPEGLRQPLSSETCSPTTCSSSAAASPSSTTATSRASRARAPATTRAHASRCSAARSPSTRTSRSSPARRWDRVDRFDTDAPLYEHIAALVRAAPAASGTRRRRADRAARERRGRRLRVLARRPRRAGRVRRRR